MINARNKIRSNALNMNLFAQLCDEKDVEFQRLLLNTEAGDVLQPKRISDSVVFDALLFWHPTPYMLFPPVHEFSELFSENLGKGKGEKAHLNLKPDAWPKSFKARVVPLAICEKVKSELNQLVKIKVLEKVYYSDWASLIVPVNKHNGSVRICDLNGAYLQIELDDESKKLVTLNTPLGPYRYKCLPFGISESGAIFQEILDKILSGVHAAHIVDDVLITGKNDSEHLENLRSVLDQLRDFGIRLNPEKCEFFAYQVKYFGFVLSAKGIEPNPRKVEAVMHTPRPRNRHEL
ncbi:hypothetical protein QYM36_008185 [Artemia franciscana]|uniref:Reverse transcriptase domain-containing protein n=1 Tax=Artemia franciscana TaxID=6661 RepID=A0AA88IHU5_ARTSF|nr:hypothetical protein QYM36_008185 [Artemia franciscana]